VSYLDPPRLNFAGIFLANPSTINNAIQNYSPTIVYNNNPPSDTNPNSVWWNPSGQAFFKIPKATVTNAIGSQPVASNDPIFGAQIISVITGAGNAQYARLVDLDPDQQAVSLVVGLAIQITCGGMSVTGVVRAMWIQDLWSRVSGGTAGGIASAGCMYQSVIENIQWSGVSPSSGFLGQLFSVSPRTLSIKFMADGYNGDLTSPTFSQGRIVGTIGPYFEGEPVSFLAQRRTFAADPGAPGSPVLPVSVSNSPMNNAPFQLKGGVLTIDLGNAVPMASPGGSSLDLGAVLPVIDPAGKNVVLAALFSNPAQFDQLYPKTAGIFDIQLSSSNASLLAGAPLAIQVNPPSPAMALVTGKPLARMKEGIPLAESGAAMATGASGLQYGLSERTDGILVDRNLIALRLERGAPAWSPATIDGAEITSTAEVTLTATQWGMPAANLPIAVTTTPNQSQFMDSSGNYQPVSNDPMSAIAWTPQNGVTDAAGQLVVTFSAQGLPAAAKPPERADIDSQVYCFAYDYFMGGVQPINFLMSEDVPSNPAPTWADVQPIFFQYMRLYPAMKSLIDLSDYATISNSQFGIPAKIQSVLGLPMSHPAFMPVTRDLSLGRRNLILLWFKNGMPQTASGA